jgi:DNA-binding MurR/RpiR family transcriptional regulator
MIFLERGVLKLNKISSILSYLKSVFNSLTKSEKKVATFVINKPDKVIYMTISEIAESVGVGDTTVLRFCKKLGFKNYQEFKLSLVQDLANKESKNHIGDFKINETDSIEELAKKVINYDISILNQTLELLNPQEIVKAKNAIIKARKIEFFGVGASIITGHDLALKLMRIGLNVVCHTDLHTQMMSASLLGPKDLAIGISFSGSSKDTYKCLEIAKKAGVKVLCVTHHAKSPITKISDITLLHGAKEDPLQGGNLSSKIAQISIFDILYHAVYRDINERANECNNKTSKAITDTLH